MIEALALRARFKLPYICGVLNNIRLGLKPQAQRGFAMDLCVQPGFFPINPLRPEGLGTACLRAARLAAGTATDAVNGVEKPSARMADAPKATGLPY
jgi:glyoxylate carboligase